MFLDVIVAISLDISYKNFRKLKDRLNKLKDRLFNCNRYRVYKSYNYRRRERF